MLKIYHNPRCGKSRKALEIIKEKGEPFEIIKYLETPLTRENIKDILSKLKMKPIDLIRQKENLWCENYKGKNLTNDQIITIMTENPKLIERPIVIIGNKAVIARTSELVYSILEKNTD